MLAVVQRVSQARVEVDLGQGLEVVGRIDAGLLEVAAEIAAGTFAFRVDREDIHLNVEARLAPGAGAPASPLAAADAEALLMFVETACAEAGAGTGAPAAA